MLGWVTIPLCRRYRMYTVDRLVDAPEPLILILQMGKVASSSLKQFMDNSGLACHVYSSHYLEASNSPREHGAPIGSALLFPAAEDLGVLLPRLRRRIANGLPIKLISGVRNPIERTKSAFVQNIESHIVSGRVYGLRIPNQVRLSEGQVLALLQRFEVHFQLEWFERELESLTGINVYSRPFPRHEGFDIYCAGHISVFLYRFEDLCSSTLTNALFSWLGITDSGAGLPHTNEAQAHLAALRQYLSGVGLPLSMEEQIRASRLFRHFYG
jgi:hypothetical protein